MTKLKTDPFTDLPADVLAELTTIDTMIGVEPFIEWLNQLEADVSKPLAKRFSEKVREVQIGHRPSGSIVVALHEEGNTEAAYKRATLLTQLAAIRSEFLTTVHDIKLATVDVRLSQKD